MTNSIPAHLDTTVTDDSTYFKPDTIDTPLYEKPNEYEDVDEVNQVTHGLETTRLDYDSEYANDGEEPLHTTVVRYKTRKTKMAPPAAPPSTIVGENKHWTSSLLSQGSSTATTTTTIVAEDELVRPLSIISSNSVDLHTVSPSISSSTIDSASSSTCSTSKQKLLDSLKRRSSCDVIKLDIRKYSLVRPHHHDIYVGGTKELAYKKRQPHSYSWGFQNILYRMEDDEHTENSSTDKAEDGDEQSSKKRAIKVAEARRRAFQKQITVEWGLDEDTREKKEDNDEFNENDSEDGEGSKSDQLVNTNHTRLLFVYTTLFENYYIRWRRPSLVSHDMVCDMRHRDSKRWQLVGEFDSHGMGYLRELGRLMIDKRGLALVNRPDHLECHLIIVCCTLVDLMREVVQKALGIGSNGVAGSDS